MPNDPHAPAIINDKMGADHTEPHVTPVQHNMLCRTLKEQDGDKYVAVPQEQYTHQSSDDKYYPCRYVTIVEKVLCPHCKQQIQKHNRLQWNTLLKSDNYLELLEYVEKLGKKEPVQKEML